MDVGNHTEMHQKRNSQAPARENVSMKGTQYKTRDTNKALSGNTRDSAAPGRECRIKISRKLLWPDCKNMPPKSENETLHTD